MPFTLCLKDKEVLSLKEEGGVPVSITKIHNKELLPLAFRDDCTIENFNKWFKHRNISPKRDGMEKAISIHGNAWLKNKNYASLTDQYWIKTTNEQWKKINFFNNAYQPDVGDVLFYPEKLFKARIYNVSPDLTTNGIVKKRWIQKYIKNKDFRSFLVKAASERSEQKPMNEVLASKFIEKLGTIKSAGYDLWIEQGILCSICENFITENTELVSAAQLYFNIPKDSNASVLQHIMKIAEHYDIPDVEEYMYWLTYVDFCTGNEDRNLSNIAFIRDVNTLKFIGPAPVYDCGNAYWCGQSDFANKKDPFLGDDEKDIVNKMKKKSNIDYDKEIEDCEKFINSCRIMSEQEKEIFTNKLKERYCELEEKERTTEMEL